MLTETGNQRWFSIQILLNSKIFKLSLNLSLTHLRDRTGPLQLGPLIKSFLKKICIMGYNLKNARDGKSISKYLNGQDWAPGITEYCLYTSLNFRKIKRICMENVALLSNNFFHTNLLIFQKIQTVIKSHS